MHNQSRGILSAYEPHGVFSFFEDICAIPHGSGNEAALAQYICDQAESFGLWYKKDEHNNVLVKKPASTGSEDKPALLLQGHIDMVCEKNADTDFDFLKDGIRLVVNGDILTADGTTLGADDGSGVAYMLAFMAMDNESFPHPPLEFCFTSGEELGFVGALGLDLGKAGGAVKGFDGYARNVRGGEIVFSHCDDAGINGGVRPSATGIGLEIQRKHLVFLAEIGKKVCIRIGFQEIFVSGKDNIADFQRTWGVRSADVKPETGIN